MFRKVGKLSSKAKKVLVAVSVIFLLVGYLFLQDRYPSISIFPTRKFGPYLCSYVFDGDTAEIMINGKGVRVRLLGIDTPESVASEDYKPNTEEGRIASEYLKSILKDQQVYLEFDKHKYDKYGRRLAYVYLSDKKTMVNLMMISEGYARVLIYSPNTRYQKKFESEQRKARVNSKGFWADYFLRDQQS